MTNERDGRSRGGAADVGLVGVVGGVLRRQGDADAKEQVRARRRPTDGCKWTLHSHLLEFRFVLTLEAFAVLRQS